MKSISEKTRRRLDIQGFEKVEESLLLETVPWLRFPFALCTLLAASGTLLASPPFLWALMPFSAIAAVSPAHPFDLIYNYGLRHFTGTRPLPERGAPNRFACGLGTVWLFFTGLSFYTGYAVTGYILGGMLTGVGILVITINFCIPSLLYRTIFGFPLRSTAEQI